MCPALKKIRRRKAGELAIEQTRDYALVASMLKDAAMTAAGVASPGACFLLAYIGDTPVGVIGVETRVDAALIRSFTVTAPMRGGGVGAALIGAARTAAHTRGARRLFALVRAGAENYLERFGFEPVAAADLLDTMAGAFMADYVRARPVELAGYHALCVDISHDGVIVR
jgi:predicted N-acetyltransferase YhbS